MVLLKNIFIDIPVYKYIIKLKLEKNVMLEIEMKDSKSSNADEKMVTLRIKSSVVGLIDKERSKYSTPRSSWITQAIVEKLEKLGYEID